MSGTTTPATATRRPGRGANPPSLRPVARPDERAAVTTCAGCRAKTPPLTLADAMPRGWVAQGAGTRLAWFCAECSQPGGQLDARSMRAMLP